MASTISVNARFMQPEQKSIYFEPPPGVEWDKTCGGSGDEFGLSVDQTSDGGYVAAGYIKSHETGDVDMLVIKVDADGNEEWNRTYGGNEEDQGYTIQQTNDGGYIVIGGTLSYGPGVAWLVKLDTNGNELWNKTYGTGNEDTTDGCQTSDGGYIFTGTIKTDLGDWDVWLVKTDSDGNIEWSKTFDSSNIDAGHSIQQTGDGGFIIACLVQTLTYRNVWLIKTDQNGNITWDSTFGEQFFKADFCAYSVRQTIDGGYILAGYRNWRFDIINYDYWLLKTYSNGSEEWSKTISSSEEDIEMLYGVRQTSDGEYIMVGSNIVEQYFMVIKAYESGNERWSKTFSGGSVCMGFDVEQTSDEGYIVVGFILSGSNSDVRMIKFEKENSQPPNAPIIDGPTSGKAGTTYSYTFVSEDPDGDDVKYFIDWGDDNTEWTDYYNSGEEVTVSHTWSKEGTYEIKAKAKDIYGAESDWGTLPVTMPVNKQGISQSLFQINPSSNPQSNPSSQPSGTQQSTTTTTTSTTTSS